MSRMLIKQIKLLLIIILISIMMAPLFVEATIWAQTEPEMATVNIPMVTYHRVTEKPTTEIDVTPQQLEKQFLFFRELGYQPITATELLDYQECGARVPKKPLVITFDDGPLSNYTKVFPLLKRFGWKATFFIYPKVIAEKSKTQLTWGQVREMNAAGMDIQSHTLSHPFLSSINAAGKERYPKWLKRELCESKTIIEKQLNKKVDLLAYPYGWFNKYVEKRCRRYGYRAVFTINYGITQVTPGRYRFDRFVIDTSMNQSVIKSLLTVKPLEIETIRPENGETVLGLTEIKFRLKNSQFTQVEIKFRDKRKMVRCDSKGVFTMQTPEKLSTGYQMVIVKAQDAKRNNYLGGWGFDYQLPVAGGQ